MIEYDTIQLNPIHEIEKKDNAGRLIFFTFYFSLFYCFKTLRASVFQFPISSSQFQVFTFKFRFSTFKYSIGEPNPINEPGIDYSFRSLAPKPHTPTPKPKPLPKPCRYILFPIHDLICRFQVFNRQDKTNSPAHMINNTRPYWPHPSHFSFPQ